MRKAVDVMKGKAVWRAASWRGWGSRCSFRIYIPMGLLGPAPEKDRPEYSAIVLSVG